MQEIVRTKMMGDLAMYWEPRQFGAIFALRHERMRDRPVIAI
jgi:hypothetical protein